MLPVAVVISSFQAERYIESAITSVLEQTFGDIEVVVQDDASTDETVRIAQRIRDRRLRVHANSSNQGAVRNFNSGIGATSADLVVKLDADDLLLPNYIATCVTALTENQSRAFVFTQGYRLLPDGTRSLFSACSRDYGLSGADFILSSLATGNPCMASSVMFRRSAFYAAGGFSDKYLASPGYEDYSLWLRMACVGGCRYISEPLAIYRVHPNGLMGRLADPKQRMSLRYKAQELEETCELALSRGIIPQSSAYAVRQLLARQWILSADGCAFLADHREFCLRKALSLSCVETLRSRSFWRMLTKLILGAAVTGRIRRTRQFHRH